MAAGDDNLDPVTILANRALLDALDALGAEHRRGLVLVGAQAIYLHTGRDDLPVSQFTTDADLSVDPELIAADPLIEEAMGRAGFDRTPPPHSRKSRQPGQWYKHERGQWIQVDLIMPQAVAERAGIAGRRSAGVEPHARHAISRARGLEAALEDNELREVRALSPGDDRIVSLRVAGPAALVIAKAHKVGERVRDDSSVQSKDAYDIYRLLRATDRGAVKNRLSDLAHHAMCGESVSEGIEFLRMLYVDEFAAGPAMTAQAEGRLEHASDTRQRSAALVKSILPS